MAMRYDLGQQDLFKWSLISDCIAITSPNTMIELTWAIFLVIILNLPHYCVQLESNNPFEVVHLTEIVNDFFPSCDIFITKDYSETHKNQLVFRSKDLSNYFPASPKFLVNFETYSDFEPLNWNSNSKSGNCLEIPCLKVSVRKYSQCALVIGLFTEGVTKLPHYKEIIVSPFYPPAKKEQDYFIFITPSSSELNTVLTHPSLSTVKFKLGLSFEFSPSSSTSTTTLFAKTVCLFCKDGEPQLIPIIIHLDEENAMKTLFPDFTRNGHGHALKISGPTKYPFLYELEEDKDGIWRSKRGVYTFIFNSMLSHFNYTYIVFPSTGHGSGKRFSNGTWNGVIGDVLYERADIGSASSTNHERYPLQLTFTTAVVYVYVSFMMGPPRITHSWKAIYWPFTPDMWLAIVISLVATIFIFKIMQRKDKAPESLLLFRHLTENVSFTLIGQGLPYPGAHSSRVLMAVWLFFALIINTLYVSKIVGLLAFPLYQKQPLTFKDLVESDFAFGFDQSGGNVLAFFKSSNNPVFHKIFEGLEPDKEAVECFDVAMQRNFACITWTGVADYIAYRNLTLSHGKNPLIFANEITLFVPCGVILQRRSLYKAIFEDILGYLRDSGQADKWNTDDYEELRKEKVHWQISMNMTGVDEHADDGPDLLSLSNLLGIFYIYIIGHVLSIMLFSAEIAKLHQKTLKSDDLRKKLKKYGSRPKSKLMRSVKLDQIPTVRWLASKSS